jgi:hypothetical protein
MQGAPDGGRPRIVWNEALKKGRKLSPPALLHITERNPSAVAPLLVALVGLTARITAVLVLGLPVAVALLLLLARGLSLRVVLLLLGITGLVAHERSPCTARQVAHG